MSLKKMDVTTEEKKNAAGAIYDISYPALAADLCELQVSDNTYGTKENPQSRGELWRFRN